MLGCMSMKKRGVGRPPETDGSGKQVAKTHVTLLLPVVLKDFLRRQPDMNMSALFTRVVTSLYLGEICPKCYDDESVKTTHVGSYCSNCSTDDRTLFFIWNDCPSCGVQYSRKNMTTNTWTKNKAVFGCWECMGGAPKVEDRMSDDPDVLRLLK